MYSVETHIFVILEIRVGCTLWSTIKNEYELRAAFWVGLPIFRPDSVRNQPGGQLS